jgi:uncharacterized membrane protein
VKDDAQDYAVYRLVYVILASGAIVVVAVIAALLLLTAYGSSFGLALSVVVTCVFAVVALVLSVRRR